MADISFEELIASQKAEFAANPDDWIPHFFTTVNGRSLMIPAITESPEDKDYMLTNVGMMLGVLGADHYYHFGDVWTVVVDPTKGEQMPEGYVHDDPRRTEALSCMFVKDGEPTRFAMAPYTRTPEGIVFQETRATDEASVCGPYTRLLTFPKKLVGTMPTHVREAIDRLIESYTITKQG